MPLALLLVVTLPAACIHDGAEPGPLAGPSELGLSLSLSASPDRLPLDGAARSVIGIHARDAHGAAVPNLTLSLQISTDRGFEDFGRLSARSVVTGSDGRASTVYTVPVGSLETGGSVDTGASVTIWVTPVGTDAANHVARTVTIRLVPPGTVIPPFTATLGFAFTPAAPAVSDQVRFTTLCTSAESTDCVRDPGGLVASYAWNFGDGGSGAGPEAVHVYERAGTYVVTLTVTDAFGRAAQVTRSITVAETGAPMADFTFSPTMPATGQTVFFDAALSTAATGREIVAYEWDFGDGIFDDDIVESHVYVTPGTYNVVLRVTDDVGRQAATMKPITVVAP